MSLKNLLSTAAAVALLAPCALAQPTVSIDLVRDGDGLAVLSAEGNWQWEVTFTTDGIIDSDGQENGDPAALTGGVTLTGANLIAGTADIAVGNENASNTISFSPTGLFDTFIPGSPVFDFETVTVGQDGAFAIGIQEDPDLEQIFVAIGSAGLGTATSETDVSVTAFTFETVGPALGALTSAGTLDASIAHGNGTVDGTLQATVSESFTATAQGGDANLDGTTDIQDVVSAVLPNFNLSVAGGFTVGDFNGDGTTDIQDVVAGVLPNFNISGAAPIVASSAAVPEPSSVLLLITAVGAITSRRRR